MIRCLIYPVVAGVLLATACGAADEPDLTSSPTVADAGTTIVEAEKPADFDEVAFAAAIRSAVDELQAARTKAEDAFGLMWRPGPDEFDAQTLLFESDAVALRESLDALPDPPPDDAIGDHYLTFVLRTEELLADTQRITSELSAIEAELLALLAEVDESASLGHPAIDELIGDHAALLASWREACFQLQSAFSAAVTEPVDCIGIDRDSMPDIDSAVDPSLVDVTLDCRRGSTMSDLPFDHLVYGFLAALPADTSWITSSVVITNHSDRPVQVQTDFRVRFNDLEGEKLLESDWVEQWEPAFHVLPGQTIHRPSYAFEGLTFSLPVRGEELSASSIAAVFEKLDTCEIVTRPEAVATDSEPFIDQQWIDAVEISDCSPNDVTGRHEGIMSVTNPTDDAIRLSASWEILDSDGRRLGMGGPDRPISAGANEVGEGVGSSVFYTMVERELATSCRIKSLEVSG